LLPEQFSVTVFWPIAFGLTAADFQSCMPPFSGPKKVGSLLTAQTQAGRSQGQFQERHEVLRHGKRESGNCLRKLGTVWR